MLQRSCYGGHTALYSEFLRNLAGCCSVTLLKECDKAEEIPARAVSHGGGPGVNLGVQHIGGGYNRAGHCLIAGFHCETCAPAGAGGV